MNFHVTLNNPFYIQNGEGLIQSSDFTVQPKKKLKVVVVIVIVFVAYYFKNYLKNYLLLAKYSFQT
jgi:hypothetical protein